MALIGATVRAGYDSEVRKLHALSSAAQQPDVISDLSLTSAQQPLWKRVIDETRFVAATLPIYSVCARNGRIDPPELLARAVEQMEGGVGLLTIHPTPTREMLDLSNSRMVPCTSRGGGIVVRDLLARHIGDENVYLKILPELLQCARNTRTVLSLGASFRSANIFDSNDAAQQAELAAQKRLADFVYSNGVDVIIESPGHARPKAIMTIGAQLKSMGYPVMPLGPIPTDTAIGCDHIAASIGAVMLGMQGAAHILAAVTREEHTGGIPTLESILEAVSSARVAAHIIDLDALDDSRQDMEVARQRQQHRTCIAGNVSRGCARCGLACPL
jgi:phosphomethylpyrimidine synthase